MNRIVYRSTSFVFAAVMTLGVLKGIALFASAPVADVPTFDLPAVVVVATSTPVQVAANDR